MATVMSAIQLNLGQILHGGKIGLNSQSIRLFQDLDRIKQTLEDFSSLQAGLAREMSGLVIPQDIVERSLRLRSLNDRLSGLTD